MALLVRQAGAVLHAGRALVRCSRRLFRRPDGAAVVRPAALWSGGFGAVYRRGQRQARRQGAAIPSPCRSLSTSIQAASAFGAAPATGFRVRPMPRHDASNRPLATGRVTLRTGARARRLILSPDGRRVEAIDVAHEGEFKRVSAEIVVLASGAANSAAQCGAIRMGATPEEAPLEQYCRSFDHSNLYVVDASFFPSSGASNPALTVAAQAIRVADRIAKIELKMSR
jgi:choline dehydrogenase-like flavoprotein